MEYERKRMKQKLKDIGEREREREEGRKEMFYLATHSIHFTGKGPFR